MSVCEQWQRSASLSGVNENIQSVSENIFPRVVVRRLREEEVASVRNKIGVVSLWFFPLLALQVFAFPTERAVHEARSHQPFSRHCPR